MPTDALRYLCDKCGGNHSKGGIADLPESDSRTIKALADTVSGWSHFGSFVGVALGTYIAHRVHTIPRQKIAAALKMKEKPLYLGFKKKIK